jgi:5,10-methylene-tetrahydrofolate dehydrogenase/methenyl tetrahydrofolate cyclohydrolase
VQSSLFRSWHFQRLLPFQASQLPDICRTADILVVAVGSPELVQKEWVKPGAVVVDVGINVVLGDSNNSTADSNCCYNPNKSNTTLSSARTVAVHDTMQQQHQQQQPLHQQHQQLSAATGMQMAQGSSPCTGANSSLLINGSSWHVVGDVAQKEVAQVASVLTPVPGGVGPMTIAAVLHNTLQAARYSAGLLPW